MAAINNPVPAPVALIPTVENWLADVNARFADNRFGQTTEADFRETFLGLTKVFADWRHLSTKRVKGGTYPVPYTDNLNQVPQDYRILGMQVEAINGVDSAAGNAGVSGPPVFFVLIRDSDGPVQALLDAEPTTTLTVKARYVRASGSEADKIASFEELELEDHPYAAGDVRRYTFPGGESRLVQWRANSVGYQHPAPTGDDSDPIYRIFAPLSASTGGVSQQYVDDALLALYNALDEAIGKKVPMGGTTNTNITGFLGFNDLRGLRLSNEDGAGRFTLIGDQGELKLLNENGSERFAVALNGAIRVNGQPFKAGGLDFRQVTYLGGAPLTVTDGMVIECDIPVTLNLPAGPFAAGFEFFIYNPEQFAFSALISYAGNRVSGLTKHTLVPGDYKHIRMLPGETTFTVVAQGGNSSSKLAGKADLVAGNKLRGDQLPVAQPAEIVAGTRDDVAITPKGLKNSNIFPQSDIYKGTWQPILNQPFLAPVPTSEQVGNYYRITHDFGPVTRTLTSDVAVNGVVGHLDTLDGVYNVMYVDAPGLTRNSADHVGDFSSDPLRFYFFSPVNKALAAGTALTFSPGWGFGIAQFTAGAYMYATSTGWEVRWAPGAGGPATIGNDSISEAQLAPAVRTKLNATGSGPASSPEQVVVTKYGIGTASPSFGAIFAVGGGIAGYDANSQFMRADNVDGYFEFTFVGTAFALWHATYVGEHYKYDVWVDGAVVATVDLSPGANLPVHEVYRKSGLTDGLVHTVRLTSVAAYAAKMVVDQIRVTGAYTSPLS